MRPLDPGFVAACPREHGFRLRGLETTRIEVFVDAAFAFAVTMLVISFDAIPRNWDELMVAVKTIPAFAFAISQVVWVWYEHVKWSRRFGTEDAATVFLSTVLLIVVLVWIYPLRILAEGLFAWLTKGYLPQNFRLESYEQLAGLFIFLGAGFASLCAVFALFYAYAARQRVALRLDPAELHATRTAAVTWAGSAAVGLVSAAAAVALPGPWTPFAGFAYVLVGLWISAFARWRARGGPTKASSDDPESR